MTEATEDLDTTTAAAIGTALALEHGDTVVAAAIAQAVEVSIGAAVLEGVAPAVAMAAVFNLLGALAGVSVATTIGKGLLPWFQSVIRQSIILHLPRLVYLRRIC